jgi:hypothetical protein
MSKQELLQKAIDSLNIQDVFFVSSILELSDDFEPKYNSDIESLGIQFKHHVKKHLTFEVEDGDVKEKIFRVYVELGARWVIEQDEEKVGEPNVCAIVEGSVVAEYQMLGDLSDEALREFALNNASFHVWPYWREYLMSQANRMNLPKTVLPAVQFATNKSSSQSSSSDEE